MHKMHTFNNKFSKIAMR